MLSNRFFRKFSESGVEFVLEVGLVVLSLGLAYWRTLLPGIHSWGDVPRLSFLAISWGQRTRPATRCMRY